MVQDDQRSWAAREAAALGLRVAGRRKKLELSAQDLAGRCGRLGMPELTRVVISRLETGKRESVTIAELAVLSAALEVAPVELLLPFGTADAEYLPGKAASPLDAARWWAGEAGLGENGAIVSDWRDSAPTLFGNHDRFLAELNQALADRGMTVTEADYRRMRWRAARPGERGGLSIEDRTVMMTIVTLRETRRDIRFLGLEPPALPPGLQWLDAGRT